MAGRAEKEQELLQKFHALRGEQQSIVAKLNELEAELVEHRIVIDTLKDLDPERKCFRMIGGVLVERTVKEVLPALRSNDAMISKVVEQLKVQLVEKGKEINEFKKTHNIRTREEMARMEAAQTKA